MTEYDKTKELVTNVSDRCRCDGWRCFDWWGNVWLKPFYTSHNQQVKTTRIRYTNLHLTF